MASTVHPALMMSTVTCQRCKRDTALVGSRCMSCYVSEAARRAKLNKYEWWRSIESMFALWMLGRYLNDGLGVEPPAAEEELRSMRILAKVKQYRQLDKVKAIIDKIDEARRKHARAVDCKED